MAKRKRLDLQKTPSSSDLETKSALSSPPRARMPIAEVAGETAGRAALEEVARAMTEAEAEGRVVKRLALADLDMFHLSRDRMVFDEDEMDALVASLAERGQQTPIEVLRLSGGKFGLISGLRRIEALRKLGHDSVLAFVRAPDSSRAQYRAMIEENEIRADLSFYERANIARVAVVQEVYPDIRSAIAGLFTHASPSKRSKIANFVTICEKLGDALSFPTAIPEKLGLALAKAIEADSKLGSRISKALRSAQPGDSAAERVVLERALKRDQAPAAGPEKLSKTLSWQAKPGRVVLSGKAITPEFLEALREFTVSQAKKAAT